MQIRRNVLRNKAPGNACNGVVRVLFMHVMTPPLELRSLQYAKVRVFQCNKHGRPNARGKCVEAAPNVLVSA